MTEACILVCIILRVCFKVIRELLVLQQLLPAHLLSLKGRRNVLHNHKMGSLADFQQGPMGCLFLVFSLQGIWNQLSVC